MKGIESVKRVVCKGCGRVVEDEKECEVMRSTIVCLRCDHLGLEGYSREEK